MIRRVWVAAILIVMFAAGCSGGSHNFRALRGSETTTDSAATTLEPTSTLPTTTIPTTTTLPLPNGSPTRPYPLAVSGNVGDYDVVVTNFIPDGTSQVLAANQFNDHPPAGFVYSLVELKATYDGTGQGSPGIDLEVGYIGADSVVYTSDQCRVVAPNEFGGPEGPSEVVAGGTLAGDVCLRLPSAILHTGKVFIDSRADFNGDGKRWWAVP